MVGVKGLAAVAGVGVGDGGAGRDILRRKVFVSEIPASLMGDERSDRENW